MKSSENIHGKALPEALFILYIADLSPSTTIHRISRYTRNREYFGTRWRRGKVLCVYSKHNNGKDRSREDHAASPSICKEYYMKTRQTIQVGSGKLVILNRVD
jgi:hypothetical protein